jgi:delta(3,5)-delta(2,4)-dienoyl-CoA isomerase
LQSHLELFSWNHYTHLEIELHLIDRFQFQLKYLVSVYFRDFGDAFSDISKDSNCRVVVLSGAGKNFCGGECCPPLGDCTAVRLLVCVLTPLGLDLAEAGEIFMSVEGSDAARKAKALLEFVKYFQDSLSSVEICPQPVIAAIHGGCIGGGEGRG